MDYIACHFPLDFSRPGRVVTAQQRTNNGHHVITAVVNIDSKLEYIIIID